MCFDFCFGLGACGFGSGALLSFFFEGGEELDHRVGVGDHLFDGGRGGVHAVLADGGEDFRGHPAAELAGAFDLGAKDSVVQSALCYHCHLLGSTKGTR